MHLGKTLAASDFEVTAPEGANTVTAKVIGVIENQAPTKALTANLPVIDSVVEPGEAQDVAQIALVERHRGTGGVTQGFVSGFGYRGKMAMASTVAHDSHHMIVVGTDRENMALAANRLGDVGGGITVFRNGQEVALVEPLSMGWCLDCHRNPEQHLRPLEYVTQLDWVPEEDQLVLGARLREENNINPKVTCNTCHR